MTTQFSKENIELLLEALRYARQTFERYPYPNAELRDARLHLVDDTVDKLRAIKREQKEQR